eukprot:g9506.t1
MPLQLAFADLRGQHKELAERSDEDYTGQQPLFCAECGRPCGTLLVDLSLAANTIRRDELLNVVRHTDGADAVFRWLDFATKSQGLPGEGMPSGIAGPASPTRSLGLFVLEDVAEESDEAKWCFCSQHCRGSSSTNALLDFIAGSGEVLMAQLQPLLQCVARPKLLMSHGSVKRSWLRLVRALSERLPAPKAAARRQTQKLRRLGCEQELVDGRKAPHPNTIVPSEPKSQQQPERVFFYTMRANGGGDGPEAVTAALFEALSLPWRPNATKICVLIADAPPHGLEPSGDGFPNGDPDGRDPLEILRDMATLGITVYTVGCEPALGAYHFARDFLCNVAEVTGGQAVALSSAAMLADVIINGSAEEIGLSKLQRQVEEEVLKVQTEARSAGHNISTEASVTAAVASLQARGLTSVQMETDGRMTNATKPCWGNVLEKKSLAKVKEELGKFAATVPSAEILPSCLRSARLPGPSMPRGYAGASAPPVLSGLSAPTSAKTNLLKTDLISGEQVSRIVQRAQCQNRLL